MHGMEGHDWERSEEGSGIDERRQDTLLRSGSGSTACVRALGSVCLSSRPRRSPVVRGGQACGSRRWLGQRGFAAAHPAMAPKKNRGGREKEEREGGRVNRSLTQIDSNFCIETRKMVNIKVVGNSKIYNFRVG